MGVFAGAAAAGHLHLIEYLQERGYALTESAADDALHCALTENGDVLLALRWLHENATFSVEQWQDLCSQAARMPSSFTAFVWLHETAKVPWNTEEIGYEAAGGHRLPVLQYTKAQGVEFSPQQLKRMLSLAAISTRYGYDVLTLKWLKEQGAPWPDALEVRCHDGTHPWTSRAIGWARS